MSDDVTQYTIWEYFWSLENRTLEYKVSDLKDFFEWVKIKNRRY